MLPPFRLGLGGPIAGGRQWMSWIHVGDLAELFCLALEQSAVRGAMNAVAPHPVRNGEFTRALAAALGRPAFFPVPASALQLMFGDMSEVMLASQRVEPRAAEAAGFRFRYPELGPALAALLR
jgi:uncharacterized protein (TIGR01777 family)